MYGFGQGRGEVRALRDELKPFTFSFLVILFKVLTNLFELPLKPLSINILRIQPQLVGEPTR